jgi:2-keto-3-deoxy-galactonokinase
MLIGHEIRSAHGRRSRVHVLGSAQLAEIYGRAFTVLGIDANALDPDSVTKGLLRLSAYL